MIPDYLNSSLSTLKNAMISVALAAYNGEKYIEEQIRSILPQLKKNDEIIVSDDNPGGSTEKIVRRLMAEDERIIYVEGHRRGVVANFANAIRYTHGDKIFLCDQDDVWLPEKVKRVSEAFESGADLVMHNCYVTDEKLNITSYSFFADRNTGTGIIKNIYKNTYMGCCMAFDRKLVRRILPIPAGIPMHDQWIGLIAERYGKVVLIDQPLIYYRVHSGNVTAGRKEASAKKRLSWRKALVSKYITRITKG